MKSNIPDDLKKRIRELPESPGIYLFKNRDKVPIYIGKALSIKKRVMSHFRCLGEIFSKEGRMLGEVRAIDFIHTPSEAEALLLEAAFVKENQPKYNQILKDDKSYPFLKITNEEFPRLLIVRRRTPDGGKYFGPYTNPRLLRQALSMLRGLFPMRTCSHIPRKVCLRYHIRQCCGPCVGAGGAASYGQIVKELEFFLKGRRDVLVKSLIKRMKAHSAKREYEQAGNIFEEIKALSEVPKVARPAKADLEVLELLRRELSLPRLPVRIEGFDISNISGTDAVGSMVVFENGKPLRRAYRKFRIKTVEGIDDYRMMREVIRRRYTRVLNEKEALPDLVLIDGGKGHLSAAKGEFEKLNLGNLPLVSIAKQHEYIFTPERDHPRILPQSSPILQLIQRLRDEAHRFAITYHRALHKKEALTLRLEQIPGLGSKTITKLLKKFGTIAAIKTRSENQLMTELGLSKKTAGNILGATHAM